MTFDTAAARATQEAASKRNFKQYQQSQAARAASPNGDAGLNPAAPAVSRDHSGSVPPVITPSQAATAVNRYPASQRQTSSTWYPDPQLYSTRPVRLQSYFAPYWSRPVVIYQDNYNSYFWWWLLDQSLENRALWAYHHRADMDDARYRELVYQDLALENRVMELEQRQLPRDPNYVPTGMDRDLMYTDNFVNRSYLTRPTTAGRVGFFVLLVPVVAGMGWFLTWLVFFKRWQTATA